MTVKHCPHCGERVTLDYESGICPKCGCPVYADDQLNHRHKSNCNIFEKRKKHGFPWLFFTLVLFFILIIILFFSFFFHTLITSPDPVPEPPQDYSFHFDYYFEDNFKENNDEITSGQFSQLLIPDLLDTDISTMKDGFLLKDKVWYNHMSHIFSSETDEYTMKDGDFVPTTEDALTNLYQSKHFSLIMNTVQLQLILLETLETDIDVLDVEPDYKELLHTYCEHYKKAAELLTSPADDYNVYLKEYTAVLDALSGIIDQLHTYQ